MLEVIQGHHKLEISSWQTTMPKSAAIHLLPFDRYISQFPVFQLSLLGPPLGKRKWWIQMEKYIFLETTEAAYLQSVIEIRNGFILGRRYSIGRADFEPIDATD